MDSVSYILNLMDITGCIAWNHTYYTKYILSALVIISIMLNIDYGDCYARLHIYVALKLVHLTSKNKFLLLE